MLKLVNDEVIAPTLAKRYQELKIENRESIIPAGY